MSDNPYHPLIKSDASKALGMHILAPMISFLGTVTLIIAVWHIRREKTRSRIPTVTYEGPLALWMPELNHAGLGLSLIGFIAGVMITNYYNNDAEAIAPTRSGRSQWVLLA